MRKYFSFLGLSCDWTSQKHASIPLQDSSCSTFLRVLQTELAFTSNQTLTHKCLCLLSSQLHQHKNLFLLHPSSLLYNVLCASCSTLGTTLAGAAADVMKPPADSWGETPSHLHHLSPPSSIHTHTHNPPIDSSTPFKCPSATWASVIEYIQGCFKLLPAFPTPLNGNRITCQNKTSWYNDGEHVEGHCWDHSARFGERWPLSSEGTPKWMLRPQWGHHAERKAIRSQLLPPRRWG